MNSLNLSKEQEDKLLQMCNDLFPEFEEVIFDSIIDLNESIIHTGNLCFIKLLKESPRGNVVINWFEVCVIHLSQKIAESYNTVYPKEKHAFIVDMMMKRMLDYSSLDKIHPVDYLFEMYQKTLEDEK